jgi:8-oxo-dGTP pyrophosphatase MutT (NUDIX family)
VPVKKESSGVFLICNNTILLTKRAELYGKEKVPVPFGGFWSLLCGGIEEGESPIDCAVREALEESKIKIDPSIVKFFGSISNAPGHVLHVHFAELDTTPKVKLNFEHTAYMWFDTGYLDEFPYKIEKKLFGKVKKYVENMV